MAQKKYGTIRAHVAAVEVERMTERFPLTKKKLAPVEKSLRRIASGSLGGEAAKKALWEVRGVFSSLVKDAERTCS